MLPDLALAALERLLNRGLAMDPGSQRRLGALAGSVFHFQSSAPDLDLFVLIGDDRLRLARRWDAAADCQLRGPASAYAGLLQARDPASYLINSPLQLTGDSERLLALQGILKDLDPDFEAPLARLFGDVLGHQLGRGLRQGGQALKAGVARLSEQADEFLREESGWFPHPEEIKTFNRAVDTLSADSDRLLARWQQFQRSRRTP
ncbi:MAG: SCP2 sterol-binding domain-containing protein [Spongiibacteraceae bacterium]|jgi:ubiquinone biosynthesis protein UbiJ|nr:SCP2 sterol-binding domain-containing protein [Spongiibacteraceae bacterium]